MVDWNGQGAQTIPNFLRHCKEDIVGGSVGNHSEEVKTCLEELILRLLRHLLSPTSQYKPEQDDHVVSVLRSSTCNFFSPRNH